MLNNYYFSICLTVYFTGRSTHKHHNDCLTFVFEWPWRRRTNQIKCLGILAKSKMNSRCQEIYHIWAYPLIAGHNIKVSKKHTDMYAINIDVRISIIFGFFFFRIRCYRSSTRMSEPSQTLICWYELSGSDFRLCWKTPKLSAWMRRLGLIRSVQSDESAASVVPHATVLYQ